MNNCGLIIKLRVRGWKLTLMKNRAVEEVLRLCPITRRPSATVGLAKVVLDAAWKSAKRCMQATRMESTDEYHAAYPWVYVEFIAGFMHCVDRVAFAILGHENRSALIDHLFSFYVKPIYIEELVDGLDAALVFDDPEQIRNAFYERLNQRQVEYGACSEVVPSAASRSEATFTTALALNVATYFSGDAALRVCATAARQGLRQYILMDLGRRVPLAWREFSELRQWIDKADIEED